MKLKINHFGKYLGTEKFDFIIKTKGEIIEVKPFHAVDEINLSSGNYVSTKALAWASIYGIKCLVTSQSGRPLGVFLPLNHDKHVDTRMKQYEAYSSHIGVEIAKSIVKTKIESQTILLEKHGITCDKQSDRAIEKLERIEAEKVELIRTKLHSIEGHFGKFYFNRIMKLFPEFMREQLRQKYKAVGVLNNLFNLGYEVLKWEVYKSVLNAHLDPYLGFLHSIQHSKPSLVCDLQEPYRPLIDDFLINYSQDLGNKDVEVKYGGKHPRLFLKHEESSKLIAELNKYLNTKIKKQRTRRYGKTSKIRTIIREDSEQLSRFIRNEFDRWKPSNIFS
jgi:CRISPR-associated protein Cas1